MTMSTHLSPWRDRLTSSRLLSSRVTSRIRRSQSKAWSCGQTFMWPSPTLDACWFSCRASKRGRNKKLLSSVTAANSIVPSSANPINNPRLRCRQRTQPSTINTVLCFGEASTGKPPTLVANSYLSPRSDGSSEGIPHRNFPRLGCRCTKHQLASITTLLNTVSSPRGTVQYKQYTDFLIVPRPDGSSDSNLPSQWIQIIRQFLNQKWLSFPKLGNTTVIKATWNVT